MTVKRILSRHQNVGSDSWDHYVLAEQTPPGVCFFNDSKVRTMS